MQLPSGPGHVFVLRSDLAALACDVCLIPESANYQEGVYAPSSTFAHALGPKRARGRVETDEPAGLSVAQRRVWASVWRPDEPSAGGPTYVLTSTWGIALEAARGVRAFFSVAERTLNARPEAERGQRGLVALPIAGAGRGGRGDDVMVAAEAALELAHEFASRTGHDVALVEPHRDKYAALQELRRRTDKAWSTLPTALARMADDIGAAARHGTLAVYAGAGLSMAAKIPGWTQLLDEVAKAHGATDDLSAFSDPLDKAQTLAVSMGEDVLRTCVAERVAASSRWSGWGALRFGLSHALLAGLEPALTITTNYDHLLEEAYEAAPRALDSSPPSLPARERRSGILRLCTAGATGAPRWLIKLHGDVSDPASIVLTPEGYEQAAFRSHALYGAVEGLLLTQRLLVVGSSMIDPPLRRIALAVRRCRGASSESRGFALLAGKGQCRVAPLWSDLFDVQSVEEDLRMAAIALDRAASRAAAADHFMDWRFESAKDAAGVAEVRRLLREVGRTIAQGDLDRHPALQDLEAVLKGMGWRA